MNTTRRGFLGALALPLPLSIRSMFRGSEIGSTTPVGPSGEEVGALMAGFHIEEVWAGSHCLGTIRSVRSVSPDGAVSWCWLAWTDGGEPKGFHATRQAAREALLPPTIGPDLPPGVDLRLTEVHRAWVWYSG